MDEMRCFKFFVGDLLFVVHESEEAVDLFVSSTRVFSLLQV